MLESRDSTSPPSNRSAVSTASGHSSHHTAATTPYSTSSPYGVSSAPHSYHAPPPPTGALLQPAPPGPGTVHHHHFKSEPHLSPQTHAYYQAPPPAYSTSQAPPHSAPLPTIAKRSASSAPTAGESPPKKHGKWTAEEDQSMTELRGNGLKWEDVAARIPGRTALGCRLRYQNYLERRAEWDEEKKNKLARLYDR